MPSTSGKQHRFMEMVAHDPKRAKQLGISPSVGKDFVEADKAEGKHFAGKKKHRGIGQTKRATVRGYNG